MPRAPGTDDVYRGSGAATCVPAHLNPDKASSKLQNPGGACAFRAIALEPQGCCRCAIGPSPPRKRGSRIRNSSNEFRPVPEWPSAPEGDCTSRKLDSRVRGNDELGDFKCDSSGGALPSCGRCNIFSIVSGTASGRNSVVECLLPKQDVVGSNPIARSNRFSLILPSELRPGLASFAFEYSLPVSWPCGKLAALSNWPRHYQGVLHGLRHPPRGRGPGELGQSLSGIGPAFRDTA